MLKCGEFKWPYCNGILRRWHERGLHTPEETAAESKPQKAAPKGADRNAWMRDYD